MQPVPIMISGTDESSQENGQEEVKAFVSQVSGLQENFIDVELEDVKNNMTFGIIDISQTSVRLS